MSDTVKTMCTVILSELCNQRKVKIYTNAQTITQGDQAKFYVALAKLVESVGTDVKQALQDTVNNNYELFRETLLKKDDGDRFEEREMHLNRFLVNDIVVDLFEWLDESLKLNRTANGGDWNIEDILSQFCTVLDHVVRLELSKDAMNMMSRHFASQRSSLISARG